MLDSPRGIHSRRGLIVEHKHLSHKAVFRADVTVVGAGPAGIVCALELARQGASVSLVESGVRRFSAPIQTLADCDQYDPRRHAPMSHCVRRQIGGASVIWGGRCLPLDEVDFVDRPHIADSKWPIQHADLQPFFEPAARYCFCEPATFNSHQLTELRQRVIVPYFPEGEVLASALERWSLPTDFGKAYRRDLSMSERVSLYRDTTCTEIVTTPDGKHVKHLAARCGDGSELRFESRNFVVACGGLETTRLLLASGRGRPDALANQSGLLGRYYMGHISGRIARIHFSGPPRQTAFGFWRDPRGVYLRPRFTVPAPIQLRERLTNIAAWLANPTVGDPKHKNGVLSFVYLALSSPLGPFFASDAIRQAAIGAAPAHCRRAHMSNVLHDLPRTLAFIPTFGTKRFLASRKLPGFFQYSHDNSYLLHYHGEQVPNRESTVTLSQNLDNAGMPRLNIDLRFSQQDVSSVVRYHELLDTYLRRHGVGRLEYLTSDPEGSVWDQATDGFHQIGTTRMSSNPRAGVVDANCKVHGVSNLFLASSSVFVTSGQANSTFTVIAFAVRLARHLGAMGVKAVGEKACRA